MAGIIVTGPGGRPTNDLFQGTSGNDTFLGGEGVDTVDYANSDAGVRVDLTQTTQFGGYAAGDRLFDIENVIGSAFNDILTGNDSDNKLVGNGGLDVIKGGGGQDRLFGGIDGHADILDGGTGSDTVDYSEVNAAMTIRLNDTFRDGLLIVDRDGSATINASTHTLNFNGNNLTYFIPAVQEDVLRNMENVIGTAFNDTIHGNMSNNVIRGGAGADYIDGKVGSDTVSYEDASFVMTASTPTEGVDVDLLRERQVGGHAEGDRLFSIENVIGSAFNDTIRGSDLNNRLEGGAGNDKLYGRDGLDTLISGRGADILDGGAGADTFLYRSVEDSGRMINANATSDFGMVQEFGIDTIQNFQSGLDKIDLREVDANLNVSGDQSFVFVNTFSGRAGELILNGTTLMGDTDGNGYADLRINVAGAARGDILL